MVALGGLVAGVAHEINTPVGVGITLASTLVDKTNDIFEAYKSGKIKVTMLRQYLEIVKESHEVILNNLIRVSELVQSFKQVAVDQTNLEKRSFVIRPYLQKILFSLKPTLKNANHTLSITGDETATISSYSGAFAQVITNLILNSITHAYNDHETGHLTFNIHAKGEQVILTYQDDGRGIPESDMKKIFDPFFTTARHRGGTGLGLHIVYNLVTQKLKGQLTL